MIIRRPPRLTNRKTFLTFLETELWSWLKDMSVAFQKLTFQENFQSFVAEDISIPAGKEVAIPNQFAHRYPGFIPNGRLIVRQTGDANIIDGNTPWTSELVFMRNPSANNAVVTIIFFK